MSLKIAKEPNALALLTDLYQLTMSSAYFKQGMADRNAVFHLFFRKAPFGGQYALAAGLEAVCEYLKNFSFTEQDIQYLRTLQGNDQQPLFDEEFLTYLADLRFTGNIDALPEGTIVFPNEPLLRIEGPLILCQLLETPLLNLINFATLIATKAARVNEVAHPAPVLEFGLRRAQGMDGAMTATRSAYIGGCNATSNVLAGKWFGVPVKGTHAHSWVMSFDAELDAFQEYAEAMPNNCVFLVDTYDTIQGVRNAITIADRLKEQGHKMIGVRLDSGDLTELSIAARALLNEHGYQDAMIVASNDLDEFKIDRLKKAGALIDIYGVGTHLVTAYDQPALGGVYKLAAIEQADGTWRDCIKLSEEPIKTSNPGVQQVRRYYKNNTMITDRIYDAREGTRDELPLQLTGEEELTSLPEFDHYEDLLQPIFRSGEQVYSQPDLVEIQSFAQSEREKLPAPIRDIHATEKFPVGLDPFVAENKRHLMRQAKATVAASQ
jgi:nicotinate phosphoribosyltransferase